EQIVSHLLKGHGREISGPFFIKGLPRRGAGTAGKQNSPDRIPRGESYCGIEPWPYDLGRARELLESAGWRDTDGDGLRDKDGSELRFRFMYAGMPVR
ncbi:unnamed protein product, partial [marine sediment metagenome]